MKERKKKKERKQERKQEWMNKENAWPDERKENIKIKRE